MAWTCFSTPVLALSPSAAAPPGKSALALCAGLEAVVERHQHSKVIVFRPLYAVRRPGARLPAGTEGEKMAPWAQAVSTPWGQ